MTGGVLAGQTLVAGVYNSDGFPLDLTGALNLDGQNDPSSVWIFQASSDLITASSSTVTFKRSGEVVLSLGAGWPRMRQKESR